MKKINLLLLFCFFYLNSFSQNIGIGTATPDASAMLEIKADTRGILIPRTSSASRIAIVAPAKGLMIYDTTTNSFWFNNGSMWYVWFAICGFCGSIG